MKLKLFGIEFEVSFLFTAVLSLMLLTDKTGLMPYFLISAALHEAAHLTFMLIFKSKPSAIRFVAGGIHIAERNRDSAFEELIILISGPLINLICFFIFRGEFSLINLILFIYNILPVDGLDGGRIVETLLSGRINENRVSKTITVTSLLTAMLFLFFFGLSLYYGIKNYTLIIFSFYLLTTLFLKKILKEKRV